MALATGISTAQVVAQLDTIVARNAAVRAVAVRSQTRQDWPARVNARGKPFDLRWCDSLLGLREALLALEAPPANLDEPREQGGEAGLVLLTPFATHELPDDIAARLFKSRVWQPEGWEIVREMFDAREVDARLARYGWLPQLLIDAAAAGAFAPVATGFLDLESAWRVVLQRSLGLESERPDAQALLAWTQRADAAARLDALPAAAQSDVCAWLQDCAGLVGKLILATRKSGRLDDALPLGLVCSVVFAADGAGLAELGHAAVRLERYVNDLHIGVVEGRAWSAAATALVGHDGAAAWQGALDRADTLLGELRAGAFAWLSDTLFSGLDQRMLRFGDAVRRFAGMVTQTSVPEAAKDAAREVLQLSADLRRHVLAERLVQRLDQVDMACRLVRWLVEPTRGFDSVAAAVEWQADEGAFVDWARFRLLGGDDLAPVSAAYAALRAAVAARRAALAKVFAGLLTRGGGDEWRPSPRTVPVESALTQLVAPLAGAHPVLLLVMDGLSVSIFRELFADLAPLSWAEWVRADLGRTLCGVAAFPTVTEVSRASLLSGVVTTGGSAQEKSAFAAHPALLAQSSASLPPRLFHKGELAEDGSLSAQVRSAINDARQKVVGVVYNAVDDHLAGPDQLHQAWRLEGLRLLLPLLREARDARRVVIVTADHGHLLDDGTRQCSGGERDRCRDGSKVSNDDEIVLRGRRVLTADGQRSVVCLWGEDTRYTGRKNGYHGGASLPELVVPMSVLVPLGMSLPGWQPAIPAQPEWWDLGVPFATGKAGAPDRPAAASTGARPARAGARKPAAPVGQGALFDLDVAVALPVEPQPRHWVDGLLASDTYAAQRRLAARVALPDQQMRALLCALDERGGKLSKTAVAQRLAVPELRLAGMLAAARRVLNVDQAPVIELDESAGMVELNLSLLLRQFGLSRQAVTSGEGA
ncbi:BREX-2 system phosphatase PglZ [Rhodocyclus purpureus]|uniref:BREX-2 system phosphatase PglZ n=1 Tax=Rhodocyclus purpureus TaxID=1067 RepID=UPI001F5DEA8F|nr:BREX-2 system phosphatase PglZ [Rhodocyclus purpureus]